MPFVALKHHHPAQTESSNSPASNPQRHEPSKNPRLRKPRPAKLRVQALGAGKEDGAEAGQPVDGPADDGDVERVPAEVGVGDEGGCRGAGEALGWCSPGVVEGEEAEKDGEGDYLAVVESVRWLDGRMDKSMRGGKGLTLREVAIVGCAGASRSCQRSALRRGGRWRRW